MKRVKNILSIAVALLFIGYYASTTMFRHTHFFEFGAVTHSHPYVPQNAHSHSAAACFVIQNFESVSFDISTSIITLVALAAVAFCLLVEVAPAIRNSSFRLYSLRAPPVC